MQRNNLILSFLFLAFTWFVTPVIASAHALPVGSSPESSQVLQSPPSVVTIQFSENVDQAASSIIVKDSAGTTVSVGDAKTHPDDAHFFSVPIKTAKNGTYIVSWSSVSADDGHFTKGGFPFVVGTMSSMSSSSMAGMSQDVEIVELSTTPEAFGSAVELAGHGFLWAALLLFALAIRQLFLTRKFEDISNLVKRGYAWFIYFGAALVFIGGAAQLLVKVQQLSVLRTITMRAAWPIYLGTDAGTATVVRLGAVFILFLVFVFGRKAITAAKKFTPYEAIMLLCLCTFAYFRAKISHATSNPFHPQISILINFFHVIEKDIWAGMVCALLLLVLYPRARLFLEALLPRAFAMLAADFGLVSVTASYIVWLHLKSFDNLFTTSWGMAFLELLIAAVFVVAMRFYHVFGRMYFPQMFTNKLPFTLALEFAFALLVVYYSSVVIITSPPLPQPPTAVFSATDQHVSITLERAANMEDTILLTTTGGTGTLSEPVVTITDEHTSTTVSVGLTKIFNGGYTFPQALVDNAGPYDVSITEPQSGGYDAHASFKLPQGIFDILPDYDSNRQFDFFTIVMICFGLAALVASIILYKFSLKEVTLPMPRRFKFIELPTIGVFLIALLAANWLIQTFHSSPLSSPYAYECTQDGNEWHTMLPSIAGAPTSQTPAEGCMWGMGNYMYMYPDKRQYDYYSSLPHAVVTLDHAPLVAGKPTTFSVSLKETDGSPAKLFVDMNKLIHVVIVSKDETVFAHIHPDDARPLTQEEKDTSTFTLDYTFPKSGQYLISVDYAHGFTLESKQFVVDVSGSPAQANDIQEYPMKGVFDGYNVSLDYGAPLFGEVTTIRYSITKDGKPVTDIVPYLEAAMHVSVVKNDFSSFLHVHGEVHPPGQPLPPIIIKNGQVIHSMAMMTLPAVLGPNIEAHFIFPSAGLYTIWGEFKVGNQVIPTAFTVKVQ